MTRKQACFLVASELVGKAKDFEYMLWANPKTPRAAIRKARIAITAAEMQARRLLTPHMAGNLPAALEAEIRIKMRGANGTGS